jgi:uncharacterized protein
LRGNAPPAIVLRLAIFGVLFLLGACAPQPAPTVPLPTSAAGRLPTRVLVPSPTASPEPAVAAQPRPATIEEVAFQSGSFHLAGDLRLPAGTGPFPAILIVHGSGPADRTDGGSYLPVFERMQQAGYAVYSWDKPGSGESTGRLDDAHVITQRAQILLDAIKVVKARPDIDPGKVGLAGISQAGYVMPRALMLSQDIAFMVCISCPGMSGVDQTTYQAMAQRTCDGVPEANAGRLPALMAELDVARTYESYDQYLRYREAVRALAAIGHASRHVSIFGVVPEAAWEANDPEIERWWNPMEAVRHSAIPILAFFGTRDTQMDPIQGAYAYRQALAEAGNPLSGVVLIQGANHGMTLAKTGCIDEETGGAGYTIAPEFLPTLEEWLRGLTR